MAERRIGPFEIHEKLGGGGMGVVYRATYTKTGQQVALKLLPPEFQEEAKLIARFERELEILKKLKHKNIVQCFGGGKHGNQRFYAMELIEGGTLADLLRDRGRIPWEETIHHARQICAALEYAHEHGIIHRDLKPGNLMLAKNGVVKLGDFGVAQDVNATGLTATGKTVGTFAYMAPEQIRGSPPVSHKTDLYALGCVLYELLTGKPPFEGDTPAKVFYQHLEQPPERVATVALDCPIWLDRLVNQLLEKDPDKRPWDASTTAQALREVEEKVAARASMVQHTVGGQPSTIAATGDVDIVRRLLKKKKKKRGAGGPFYEQTWFLVGCLTALLAGAAWSLWPLSEEKLFAKADQLMASDDASNWLKAEKEYLKPLLQKYPTGKFAPQVQQHLDKIEMYRAEERFKINAKLGRELKTEGERLYADAWKYEQFGDRISALEKYHSMVNLLQANPEARPYANLARRQIARIEASGGGKDDRLKIVNAALAAADEHYQAGRVLKAREIWTSLVTLYESNRELKPQVRRAKARLADKEEDASAASPPASEAGH